MYVCSYVVMYLFIHLYLRVLGPRTDELKGRRKSKEEEEEKRAFSARLL